MEFIESQVNKFLDTAVERHRIYLKKETHIDNKPWTNDPIFQNYFFCNVHRWRDKCTRWIINHVVPLVNENIDNWPLIILYRFISTYEVFKHIEYHNDIDDIEGVYNYLKNLHDFEETIFNGCFLRNPRIKGGWTNTYKVPFHIIEEIKENKVGINGALSFNSLENLTLWFTQFSATSGFMGYEYSCDFEYTKWFSPTDKYTWCNKGPGAQKGLSWLIYGNSYMKFTLKEWDLYTKQLFHFMTERFGKEFPNEVISMREVEHWMCEFQKYKKYSLHFKTGEKCKYRKYQGV